MKPFYQKLGIDNVSLEKALNFLPYPFLVSESRNDTRHNIFVNKKFTEEIGYTCADIPTIEDWFNAAYPDPSYRNTVVEEWLKKEMHALNHGGDEILTKACIQTKSGKRRWYEVKASISGTIRFVAFININEDVSREEELQRLVENKDRLLSILSHDLRMPLSNLYSVLDLAASGHLSEEESKHAIKTLSENVFQVIEFLDTTLHWTRANFDNHTIEKEKLDIAESIHLILLLYKNVYTGKNISITTSLTNHLPAYGDPEIFSIVIRNLLSNAIKFTPVNGAITITNEISEKGYVISIKNSGKGISKERIQKISSEHYHSQPGTKGEKGLGLGLSLCRQLLSKIGGHLDISSVENESTVMSIVLKSN